MIKRTEHKDNYTVIDNSVFQSGMSLQAIGLLCYMLSMKDDWQFYQSELQTHFRKCSENTLRKYIKELKENGYLEIKRENIKNTNKIKWSYEVVELRPSQITNIVKHEHRNYEGSQSSTITSTNKTNTNNKQILKSNKRSRSENNTVHNNSNNNDIGNYGTCWKCGGYLNRYGICIDCGFDVKEQDNAG